MAGHKKKAPKAPSEAQTKPPQTPPKKSRKPKSKAPVNTQKYINHRALVKGAAPHMEGFYDPTSGTHEIRFKVTDYFDSYGVSANPRVSYLFKSEQSLLIGSADTGMNSSLVVVSKATFYALPRFDVETANSAKLIAFTLPVNVTPNTNRSACQQTTLLTPSSVSNWVKVGSWGPSVFKDSLVFPSYNDMKYQCLGTLAVLDPDNMQYSDSVVQFRVEYEVTQTISPVLQLYAGISEGGGSSWSTPPDVALAQNPVLIDVVGLSSVR